MPPVMLRFDAARKARVSTGGKPYDQTMFPAILLVELDCPLVIWRISI